MRGVLCAGCLEGALPFVGLAAEGDYRGALREYREGLGSGAADLEGLRFDPFDEEVRAVLGAIDVTLRGCEYTKGGDMAGRQRGASTRGGCSLALAFHNVRSAKGGNLELLEAELRRWGVAWDVIGLAETWLDEESEAGLKVQGYDAVCASRKERSGGGVALLVREGLTYKERPDLGVFEEGLFESTFVEIIRGGGRRNDVVGAVYRPPGVDMGALMKKLPR